MHRINITRSSMPDMDEYINEIRDMWSSRWLTNMGVKHQELQQRLQEYLGVENIHLLTNGHMALELSIQAFGLTRGEVITTPFTFASTTHAIVRNGLTPVFCDIDPITLTIDSNKIEKHISDKTVAILPVHVYGNVCDIDRIEEIGKKYGLKIIYDAAHTFGEKYKGSGLGSYGDASCYSFHATKVFNTIEGGAVCFHDEEFGKNIYRLKNFGIKNEETVDGIGTNAKLNEFCAAMGLCNLRHVDEEIFKRKKVADRYREQLDKVAGIRLNIVQDKVDSNYAYFPIFIDEERYGRNRNAVMEKLSREDIGTRKYFYPLTSRFDCYNELYEKNPTPIALAASECVLALPMYADLNMKDVDRICSIIRGLGE